MDVKEIGHESAWLDWPESGHDPAAS